MAKGFKGPGMGRPKSDINKDLFEKLMSIPFAKEINVAECLGVEKSTLVRWIKEQYEGCTFADLKAKKMEGLKLKLAGKQFDIALKGNVPMLIFLGKNYLDQSDKTETKLSGQVDQMTIQETAVDQLARIKEMVKDELK